MPFCYSQTAAKVKRYGQLRPVMGRLETPETYKDTLRDALCCLSDYRRPRLNIVPNMTFANTVTHHLRDHRKGMHAFARTGTGAAECSVLAATFSSGESWS